MTFFGPDIRNGVAVGLGSTAGFKSRAFAPNVLFAQGEQGFWYDPTDIPVNWRRNLLTYTEQFDNAAWVKAAVNVTPNSTVAPDGTTTADSVIEDTTTSIHRIHQPFSSVAGFDYVVSVYVKVVGARRLFINAISIIGAGALFDFTGSGSVINISGTAANRAASITALPDNWFRCQILGFGTGNSNNAYYQINRSAYNTASDESYLGDGTSGFILWGAQLERGSTASAYQRIVTPEISFLDYQPQPVMYTDSAGTTPVTAVEQAVGLVLDKSRGLVLGGDLVTNGTFNTDTTGWTAVNTPTLTVGANGVTIQNNGTTSGILYQAMTCVAGRAYQVSVKITYGGTGFARCETSTIIPASVGGTVINASASGTYSFVFVASATTMYIVIGNRNDNNASHTYDNISVRELAGNHAIQPTSASRPTLRARYNLALGTEAIGGANWTNYGTAPTMTSATDPLGGSTATTLDDTDGAGFSGRTQNFTVIAGGYSASAYVKAETADGFSIWAIGSVDGVLFQDSLTWTAGVPTGTGWTAISVGGGYYRVSKSFTAVAATQTLNIYLLPCRSIASLTGSTTFWGADVRRSCDTYLPYQRIAAATDYDTVGFPVYLAFDGSDDSLYTGGSIDFATVTSDGQARRNIFSNPTQFDATYWSQIAATVTANSTAAPDGTNTADKLVENAAAANHYVSRISADFTASTTYTLSAYVKAAERQWVAIGFFNESNRIAWFDVANGVVGTKQANISSTSIENVGNGWYRCIMTTTSASVQPYPGIATASANGTSNYTGDGTSGIFIWGAQLETGSTATAFQNIGTDKMTVWAGVTKLSDAAQAEVVELSSTVANNGTFSMSAPTGAAQNDFRFRSNGTALVSATSPSTYAAPTTRVLTGIGDISGDVTQLRIDGAVITTDNSDQGTGNYSAAVLNMGRRNNTSNPFNGRLYQLIGRGAATSAALIQQAERWIAGKQGRTL